MTTSPRMHHKLNTSESVTVSVDSLLDVLSSAYGTEELNSDALFQSNSVNWRNISVEQLTQKKNEDVEQKPRQNEMKKINVSTSTSSIKLERRDESKIDLTLVSIKNLEKNQQPNKSPSNQDDISSPHLSDMYKQQSRESLPGENLSSLSLTEGDCIPFQEEMINNTDDKSVIEVIYDQPTSVCGFSIDNSNQELLFDVKFCHKVTNKYLPNFVTDEQDIIINVEDLVKQNKSQFAVSKSCMVSKCQFFAKVEKEFGLDNLKVYIKCDINIFTWIIQWVRADTSLCKPDVCLNNLKTILSIAYNLGIHSLVEECLDICCNDLKSVLEADCSIEHIFGEDLMLKLVKRFSNSNVNEVSDEFESFKMKMYCGLARILADQNQCFEVGHYSTLATMFQCKYCKKLLNHNVMDLVPCTSDHSQVDFKGNVNYYHDISPSWDLSKYFELTFEMLPNWKEVYWYLWGMCHFMYCVECQVPYPASQSEWCPYHSEGVEYFPLNSNLEYPIGTYTCCGAKAFKFNVLQTHSGCKFKSHSPDLSLAENKAVHLIYEVNKHLISRNPPESTAKTFVKLVKHFEDTIVATKEVVEQLWWGGRLLAPKRKKDYSIISSDILNWLRDKPLPKKITPKQKPLIFEAQVHFGAMPSSIEVVEEYLDSLQNSCPWQGKKDGLKLFGSNFKLTNGPFLRNKMKKKKCSSVHLQPCESTVWSCSQSNKTNQDNQRDFEEVAMRRLVKILSSSSPDPAPEPVAGSYIRLEAERLQDHCAVTGNNSKHSSTVVNRTFPLSWFRRSNLLQ